MNILATLKLPAFFADDPCAQKVFFGFPHWWQYMPAGQSDGAGGCALQFKGLSDALPIGLAVLDMLLYAAGFVAVLMIIAGGLEYIFAGGEPDKGKEARQRIQNSLIGLIIAVIATAVVSFIGNAIK